MQLSAVYCYAVELGLLLGVKDLKDYPEPWVCKVDDHWTFAMNGCDEPKSVNIENSMGIEDLKPYQMAVWFNGWLAGILSPTDGIICAGEAGNEDDLIQALIDRIAMETLANEMKLNGDASIGSPS